MPMSVSPVRTRITRVSSPSQAGVDGVDPVDELVRHRERAGDIMAEFGPVIAVVE